jgi:hypothetical protein
MNPPWIMAAVFLVPVAIAAILGWKQRRTDLGFDRPWPLEATLMLLTQAEQMLYRRLQEALPGHIVLAQVRLLQVVRFKGRTRELSVMNRISQLSLDFLAVTPDTRVVAAIELDDSSHDRAERRTADARKTHALKSAGIPLLRWSLRKAPDAEGIRLAIAGISSSA